MYDDFHASPRGIFSVGTLTNAAQGVGEAAGTVAPKAQKILGGTMASTGAVERIVTFRRQNGGTTYFQLVVRVAAVGAHTLVPPFNADGGLEVLTTAPALDLVGVITYWKPT